MFIIYSYFQGTVSAYTLLMSSLIVFIITDFQKFFFNEKLINVSIFLSLKVGSLKFSSYPLE